MLHRRAGVKLETTSVCNVRALAELGHAWVIAILSLRSTVRCK
jgi:hypothetical protein